MKLAFLSSVAFAFAQGQRRVAAGAVQGMGLGRAYRDLPGALSDADQRRRSSCSARSSSRPTLQEPPIPGRHERVAPGRARCRPISPTRATAMSPRRSSTSITACPTTTRRSSAWASASRARSSSRATAAGWRGLKPKLAQEHGAVGCIIYSDPADDGYAQDDVYPQGTGASAARHPARLGRRHDALCRRSADARHRRHQRRQAPDARGRARRS